MLLLGLWLALVAATHAAPGFDPPSGWVDGAAVDGQARRRADAWAEAWGADVRWVMSTRANDDFVETLAILDAASPLPAAALADLEAGRSWLEPRVVAALGTTATLEPDGLELRPHAEPGVAVLVGRVRHEGSIARVAVAPNGARHLVVVLLASQAEAVLHARVLDDVLDGLDGLRPPIAPLRRGLLLTIALLSWLLVGAAAALQWTRRSLPSPGARVAGRQVAAALFVAAVLVLVIAGSQLGKSGVELSLAGSSPWGFAAELALGGAVMAVLVLVATELWERRLRPVASAPNTGSFARISATPRRADSSPAAASPLGPAVTGDTHVGRPPAVTGDTQVGRPPAVTGDTQVGRPPAVTGDTQVGRPPAVGITGNTKVGPAPIPIEGYEDGPPVREVISGDIEVQTQVRRIPEPDTVKTTAPSAPAATASRPKLEIDWS